MACEVCGETRVIHSHHVLPKSLGGKDREENLIELCPNCHAMAHGGNFFTSFVISKDKSSLIHLLKEQYVKSRSIFEEREKEEEVGECPGCPCADGESWTDQDGVTIHEFFTNRRCPETCHLWPDYPIVRFLQLYERPFNKSSLELPEVEIIIDGKRFCYQEIIKFINSNEPKGDCFKR